MIDFRDKVGTQEVSNLFNAIHSDGSAITRHNVSKIEWKFAHLLLINYLLN